MDSSGGGQWDMHGDPSTGVSPDEQLPLGTVVRGVVVCHHAFGLGVRLTDPVQFGHVNVTEVSDRAIKGPADFPGLGTEVRAVVLGYTGLNNQLRLTIRVERLPEGWVAAAEQADRALAELRARLTRDPHTG